MVDQHLAFLAISHALKGTKNIDITKACLLVVYIQHATCAAKFVVGASEVHRSDAILPQCCSTHDARLDCDVEVRFMEHVRPVAVLLHDLLNANKFGMTSTLYTVRTARKYVRLFALQDLIMYSVTAGKVRQSHTFKDRFVSFIPLPMILSS